MSHGYPAGRWHFVLDGVVVHSSDMLFEMVHRRGATDDVITSVTEHLDPKPGSDFTATILSADADGAAVDYQPGDLLVFRYTVMNPAAATCWTPNGDGSKNGGAIPNITPP